MGNKIQIRLIILQIIIPFFLIGQTTLDKSLLEMSYEISNKLVSKGKSKLVVLFITDIGKSETNFGKYTADKISSNIVNSTNNFQVFDRDNLGSIVEAKKLIAEGYIDASEAKSLGKLLSVEVIIVGKYTVLNNSVNIILKAIDINNGLVICTSDKNFPYSNDMASLLGINVGNEYSQLNEQNLGFNDRPINSNEVYNNPHTVRSDCKTKNTGDYCFKNITGYKLRINFISRYDRSDIVILHNQTQCLYNIPVTNADVYVAFADAIQGIFGYTDKDYFNTSINIEKCKSKTYTIK